MENNEKVIGMLRHVTIGLCYWSRECTPSWTSDDEEEYTEVTDHGRDSRGEDCVAIVFVMVTVVYVSMTPRASSVVGRCSGFVIRVVFLNNYRIMKGAKWGSGVRRTRVV